MCSCKQYCCIYVEKTYLFVSDESAFLISSLFLVYAERASYNRGPWCRDHTGACEILNELRPNFKARTSKIPIGTILE